MQVSVTHMLNHILHKQNPSHLFHIQLFAFSFFKWGALVLALLTTYRIVVVTFLRKEHTIPLLDSNYDDDFDFSDSDDDEIMSSSDSEDDNTKEEEDDDDDNDKERRKRKSAYFRVNGSGSFLRHRSIADLFSFSEIVNVKLGFGLGLEFDSEKEEVEEKESIVSLYDNFTTTTAMSSASPAVVVSAGENALGMRIWDARLRRRAPAVIAEWGPTVGENVGVELGGEHKVFVKDNGRYGLTVGDIRNVKFPLVNLTESYVDAWWPNSFMFKLQ